uniref:Succinate dehydrogenase cytochrome b560 subunit, mitochondrial n=1 Tax=Panagrellus redivivus TaxID=6233 RepID=A0A7E4ZZL8_PANRE
MNASRSLSLKQAVALTRQFQTSVAHRADPKNAVQQWGWEYLKRQEASGRPLSPHITIYQQQLTWGLSGFHRISGCVMAGTLLVGGVGFAVLPIDFTTFIDFVRSLNIPCAVTAVFKFIIAFPICFHTLNGIRFLGFDLAKGTDIASVYKSGYLVFGLSFLIALLVVANSIANKKAVAANKK